MSTKLWGGRFQEESASWVNDFGASINFDQLMADEDVEGSLAHVKMLGKTGILPDSDVQQIIVGLEGIQSDLHAGKIEFSTVNEDVHMNIESILTDRIGPVAGKLHTARSRNDQVATDFHLYLKNRLPKIIDEIGMVQSTLVKLAEENVETIMPGYTHLQHAQPISYGHYLMAYYQMLKRDKERFTFNEEHTDMLPLGAAALAGTTFPIDRQFVARELGFSKVYANSLDAVSDRDFALEFLSNASILMMHLSRFCEELSMWVSYEFNYIELSDAFTTGSSIMPQKKNPDMAELIRGKSGRVYGHLMGLLATMKSLPLAYNKDLQEDKEGTFDTIKTILPSLKVLNGMLKSLKVNKDKMHAAVENDFSNATELADYLATKGIPFREAHKIVGELVLKGIQNHQNLQDISLTDYKKINPKIDQQVYEVLKPTIAVERRHSEGGTGFDQVKKQIELAKVELNQ
ncbi:argininosuccinate lyase [Secundilactobacillus malefermentans]|uniref:argininosuccinate lyase n=1 Tax=Secundilactobacillus malefermentans TaxID=176292 RepID=UPI0011C76643|nr:argininosuccinate lyase [Secundilactobacillus malefermentans]QEA30810.1 argininosuccinate lyase [Secundilactobacillus malefermentans]